MEQKRSKVTGIIFGKSGQGKNGPWHLFTIGFENGDSGSYFANTNPQTYFVSGQEADYTKEITQNGNHTNTKISPVRNQNGQGGKPGWNASPTAQNKRTALECAVSLAVAGKIPFDQIGATAVKYMAWLDSGAVATPKQEPAKPAPAPTPAASPSPFLPPAEDNDDSLPF